MTKTCPMCGREFTTDNWRMTYCSEMCAKEAKREWKRSHTQMYKAFCPVCGKEFETSSQTKIYCSDRCRGKMKVKARDPRGKKLHTKVCVICGKEFVTKQQDAKYCCDECRKEGAKIKRKEAYDRYRAAGKFNKGVYVPQKSNVMREERKRLGAWYGKIVDRNAVALENAPSYGKAYAPKVEVFIPLEYRRNKC